MPSVRLMDCLRQPKNGEDLCSLLSAPAPEDNRLWSHFAQGPYIEIVENTYPLHIGGCYRDWPRDGGTHSQNPLDNRAFVPFWGTTYKPNKGGCCHTSYDGDQTRSDGKGQYGQVFTLSVASAICAN